MPCGSVSSRKAGLPPFHSDWCTWLDDPARSWLYFAMKVAAWPWAWAISFTPFLMIACMSQVSSASEYFALTSSCPTSASPLEHSIGTPAFQSPLRIARITVSSFEVPKMA